MHVAFVNKNEPIERNHYICSVCKTDFVWDDGCGYYEKFSKNFCGEEYFYICSIECRCKATKEKMIEKFYK